VLLGKRSCFIHYLGEGDCQDLYADSKSTCRCMDNNFKLIH
jgi:hypothetical protein